MCLSRNIRQQCTYRRRSEVEHYWSRRFLNIGEVWLAEPHTHYKKTYIEMVDYNPIQREKFLILIKLTGFIDINWEETGLNVTYTAIRG